MGINELTGNNLLFCLGCVVLFRLVRLRFPIVVSQHSSTSHILFENAGPIPTELGRLISLTRLFLHENQLTGTSSLFFDVLNMFSRTSKLLLDVFL